MTTGKLASRLQIARSARSSDQIRKRTRRSTVPREHLRHSDVERFSIRRRSEGSRIQRARESQAAGRVAQRRRTPSKRTSQSSRRTRTLLAFGDGHGLQWRRHLRPNDFFDLRSTKPSAESADPSYFPPASNRSSSFNENLHTAAAKDFGLPSNAEEEQLQMQIALAESQREVKSNAPSPSKSLSSFRPK